MTPSPTEIIIHPDPFPQDDQSVSTEIQQDELDGQHLNTPTPIRLPPRSARKSVNAQKKLTPGKGKRWRTRNEGIDGECHLLNLPVDVLHVLLARLPPRSLRALSVTCKTLREDLSDDGIWRQSYANRFMWDGAAREIAGRAEMKVLVQGCMGDGGRGWRREALNRESMLERWTASKQDMVLHHPPLGLIESISLSYPTYAPPAPKSLVVGKSHPSPTTAGLSVPLHQPASPVEGEEPVSTPTKLTHRQKYEALIAATTRPAPYILSSSLFMGSIVRSDPLSGKPSKGFWGPGRDANFHLRPHLDQSATPSTLYLNPRDQTRALWGLMDGSCVHTTLASKSQSSQGGRAASINVVSAFADCHDGEVCDIWMDPKTTGTVKWVTGGSDGRVKYWQLVTTEGVRSGKRNAVNEVSSTMVCLFTSPTITSALPDRSEAVKRRQNGKPDDVVLVRCDDEKSVVCGITEDGDLRIWFHAGSGNEQEVRIDAGSAEETGGVRRLALDARDESKASVLVHHHRSAVLTRFDVTLNEDGSSSLEVNVFQSPVPGAFSAVQASLRASPAISTPAPAPPILAEIDSKLSDVSEASSSGDATPVSTPAEVPELIPAVKADYGRFIATGDEHGVACLWAWDSVPGHADQSGPLRAWAAATGRITAIEVSCGLVAIGTFDGHIKVFDPLPDPPVLLRSFHASRLSAADAFVAASDGPDARYFNVNQIILENDLIVATIGRKVFAWKAGVGKGRTKVDSHRKANGQKSDSKSSAKNIDAKSLRQQSLDTQDEIRSQTTVPVRQSNYERAQFAAMDNMGLEDGDDALQYALMLSMDEQQQSSAASTDTAYQVPSVAGSVTGSGTGTGSHHGETPDSAKAELQEMLEMIRVAEERERAGTSI